MYGIRVKMLATALFAFVRLQPYSNVEKDKHTNKESERDSAIFDGCFFGLVKSVVVASQRRGDKFYNLNLC